MHKHINTLPLVGHSRWKQIEPFVGMCRESWRQRCLAGLAPPPIQLSARCTVWMNSEVHLYLSDPVQYGKARAALRDAPKLRLHGTFHSPLIR